MRKPKVLIVDDEPHIVNLVKLTLQDKFETVEAYSGTQALEMLEVHAPDLIVLDLMMPGMDGYQTCEKIRANPKTSHIPIMILSAKSQIVDKFKSINVGADDYMVKPFEPKELEKRIKQNLSVLTPQIME